RPRSATASVGPWRGGWRAGPGSSCSHWPCSPAPWAPPPGGAGWARSAGGGAPRPPPLSARPPPPPPRAPRGPPPGAGPGRGRWGGGGGGGGAGAVGVVGAGGPVGGGGGGGGRGGARLSLANYVTNATRPNWGGPGSDRSEVYATASDGGTLQLDVWEPPGN